MITIELDSGGVANAAENLKTDAIQALCTLLDRCDAEDIHEVTLRFPPAGMASGAEWLQPVLARRFRFRAWFRSLPTEELAGLFISAGHSITLTGTASADGLGLKNLLNSPVVTGGESWQFNLFLALPAPPPDVGRMLGELEPRPGINLTLGLAWDGPEMGPSLLPLAKEEAWAEVLLTFARWGVERGVTICLACGLPLCVLSTEQLGELALLKIHLPMALCTPSLVVTLDGRARVCPRLPLEGWAEMPAGVGLQAMESGLIKSSSYFAAFCNRPNEHTCRSLATGACGGGCVARNALGWRSPAELKAA